MTKVRMDIAIAGMGIGGLALANFLIRQGHRIVLYDQMPKPGPVGSGFVLQPTGLIVLDQLGLRDAAEARGQRIDRMLGKLSKNDKTVLDVGYREGDYGIAIIRWALFDILYRSAANAGVGIATRHKITAIELSEQQRFIYENGDKSPKFDLLIDAMGARSPLRKVKGKELDYGALWVNLPWHDNIGFERTTLEQRYEKASCMIGVLPLGKAGPELDPMTTFFWSIKHQDVNQWRQQGLAKWVDEVCAHWPQVAPFLANIENHADAFVHANYRHHTHIQPTMRGFTRLGDAYHATSPQLGQGANMALLDALALSQALAKNTDLDAALKSYVSRRRLHLLFYQTLSYYLTPFYQSDNRILPFLRDYLIAPTLRRRGLVHAMVAGMVTGQLFNPIKRAMR